MYDMREVKSTCSKVYGLECNKAEVKDVEKLKKTLRSEYTLISDFNNYRNENNFEVRKLNERFKEFNDKYESDLKS